MSEGWEDWPLLGPGWKRRTAVRKSGQSCGHSDTYYQSPTGQRFRSKPELAKFLGESIDLSCFNFKHGTLIPLEKRKKSKKKKKASPTSPVNSTSPTYPVSPTSPALSEQRLSLPLQSPDEEHQQNGTDGKTMVKCCTGCKNLFTGVEFGRSKQTIWYCADCRASRRAFNKEQKLLKSTGCGKCAACSLTENCGYCSVCLLRSHNPEFRSSWKCVKRRCLKAIYKPGDCGTCQGCTATEDCESCSVCLKRQKNPELEISNKCVKRKCNKDESKPETRSLGKKSFAAKKLKTKWRLMSERDGSSHSAKHKKKSYYNKVKGKTEKKRPKEKNIPVNLKSSNHPVILERLQKEKLAAGDEKMTLLQEQQMKLAPRLPIIKLERLDYKNGGYKSTEDGGSWIIGKVETKPIKKECEEHIVVAQEVQEEPLDLHCPVKTEEFVTETNDVEAADECTPVITQIFSLGSMNAKNSLDPILQEFLTELNEIPLPAHWEVLSNTGPTLKLVQRSKLSTMAETVVHIEPGLYFNIVVRECTLPSYHELYQTHASRITTVDEVVELICDLEAYRPCMGFLRQRPYSPNCHVLVYGELCQACSLNPWPSGFVR